MSERRVGDASGAGIASEVGAGAGIACVGRVPGRIVPSRRVAGG